MCVQTLRSNTLYLSTILLYILQVSQPTKPFPSTCLQSRALPLALLLQTSPGTCHYQLDNPWPSTTATTTSHCCITMRIILHHLHHPCLIVRPATGPPSPLTLLDTCPVPCSLHPHLALYMIPGSCPELLPHQDPEPIHFCFTIQ